MNRFHAISWSGAQPFGVIAGGKENGEVDIYDPATIISGKSKGPLAQHAIFSGPVKGLEFSTVNSSLLGAGGPDGDVR